MIYVNLTVPAKTLKFYSKAADEGDAEAPLKLGRIYESGRGVSQDYVEAATWYRRAAEQGNREAQSPRQNR